MTLTPTTTFFRICGFLLVLLLLQMPNELLAQKKYKTHGRKCARVTISDPGELYSTYEITAEDKETLSLNEGLGPDLTGLVVNGSSETSDVWPEGMRGLDSRLENREVLMKYKAFRVAELGDMYVLVIPAKYNKSQPTGFAPNQDFFLLINVKGVE